MPQQALNKDRCIIRLYIETLHQYFKDNIIAIGIRCHRENILYIEHIGGTG